MQTEDYTLCLQWSDEFVGQWEDEPSTFLYETSGKVVALDGGDDALAGRFSLFYVDIDGVLDSRTSLFDVMDQQQATHDYYAALIEAETYYFNDAVQRALGAVASLSGNLLILDRLELLPAYRGHRHGLVLLREMIRRFGHGAGLVAIKPFPLQFEHPPSDDHAKKWRAGLGLEAMPRDKRTATHRLCEYYEVMGFRRVARTPFMVLCPETTQWRTSLDAELEGSPPRRTHG